MLDRDLLVKERYQRQQGEDDEGKTNLGADVFYPHTLEERPGQ